MGLDNPIHIAILLLVVLLVFGAKRLPELGHSLGSGMRGFKDAIAGVPIAGVPDQPAQLSAAEQTVAVAPAPAPLVSVVEPPQAA
jgi:sec-independent protein translocase protein TatA